LLEYVFFFFFFSSRRRHTRWPRDWSSDVCSSDLGWRGASPVRSERSNGPQPSSRRAISRRAPTCRPPRTTSSRRSPTRSTRWRRSEEHTSELQSRGHLVCRLLLEKKKQKQRHQDQ